MKMYNKESLEYKGGYIVEDNKVICVDNEVVDLFNKLETDIQRAKFEKMKGKLVVDFGNNEFHRKSELGEIFPNVEVNTPCLDEMAEKAEAIMDEIDAMNAADVMNEYFAGIKPLIAFVNDEFVIDAENSTPHRFDLPTIGNPLELTKEKLSELVIDMFS